ncbi:Membrane protein OS=Streptomyces antimycoticus OX=68175 GN=SANT12839_045340 PE=4 SV=1 [Streptomyces antimycoticus]
MPSKSVESPRGGQRGPMGTGGGSAGAPSPRERLPHRPKPSASASTSSSGVPSVTGSASGTSDRPSNGSRSRPGLGTTPRSPRHPLAPTAGPSSLGGAGGGMSAGGSEGGLPEDDTSTYSDPAADEAPLGGLLG